MPDYTALQAIETAGSDGRLQPFVHSLIARNSQGDFTSRVQMSGQMEGTNLLLQLGFEPDFEGVSLPYNLLAVLIIDDEGASTWMDFTNACDGPGIGFFPGKRVNLPAIKLKTSAPHKLRIMVWGKI